MQKVNSINLKEVERKKKKKKNPQNINITFKLLRLISIRERGFFFFNGGHLMDFLIRQKALTIKVQFVQEEATTPRTYRFHKNASFLLFTCAC